MKLAVFQKSNQDRLGAVKEDLIVDLPSYMNELGFGALNQCDSVKEFLALDEEIKKQVRKALEGMDPNFGEFSFKINEVDLKAPLPNPGKLLCIAGNYADHIIEGGGSYPGKDKMVPRFFLKPSTSVIGPKEKIRVPPSSAWTDWEIELAIVIGKSGRSVSPEEASDYIAGYTILNDVSARELSFREDLPTKEGDDFFDWLIGKWPDTFAPMGPWVVTKDEIQDPTNLEMKLWVNDELHQEGNSGQMIFNPEEVITFITQFLTLKPGDIISTGTPAGVGYTQDIRIKEGDILKCHIDQLGTFQNLVEYI
ncbi:MAG: fumarylacetoacetate hydrolase family protein [Candidatus Acetothermia bacterium]